MSRPQVASFFVSLALSFAATGTVALAWSGPPAGTPPANNVAAPINVGSTFQDKAGAAWFDGGVGINSGSGFCIGGSCITSWAQASGPWTTSGNNISNSNTGGVGIGTTNIVGALTVGNGTDHTLNVRGDPTLFGFPAGLLGPILQGVNSAQNAQEPITLAGTNINLMGNVGIGTVSPGAKLDVNGTVNAAGATVSGSGITVNQGWSPAQAVSINSNQVWKSVTTGDPSLYFQWSNPGGQVVVGGQTGATNQLTVYGPMWARDSVTAPKYCIGASCITSWPSGIAGTAGRIPRFATATTLGDSSIASDGVSSTANGNFFVTGDANVTGNISTNRNYIYLANMGDTNHAIHNMTGDGEQFRFWNFLDLYQANGGASRLYINGAGNVGIGTQSPTQKLDVNGYVRVRSINGEGGTIALDGNNGTTMFVENLNGVFRLVNSPWTAQLFSVDQSGNVAAAASVTSPQYCIGASCITSWPSTGTNYWTWDGAATLSNNKGSNMNVYSLLSAVNPNAGSGYAQISSGTTANAGYNAWFRPNGQRLGYLGWDPTNLNLNLENGANFVVTNGNVGIGTMSPGTKLDVVGSGGTGVDLRVNGRIQTGDGGGAGGVWLNSGNTMFVGQSGTNAAIWTAGAGWALNVTQAGNVGIGTASPVNKLAVVAGADTWAATFYGLPTSNTVRIGTISGGVAAIGANNNAGNAWADLEIAPAGNVGVGTASPAAKLDVNGTVNADQFCDHSGHCINPTAIGGFMNRRWYSMMTTYTYQCITGYDADGNPIYGSCTGTTPIYQPNVTYVNTYPWPIEESVAMNLSTHCSGGSGGLACTYAVGGTATVDGVSVGGSYNSGYLAIWPWAGNANYAVFNQALTQTLTFTVPPGSTFSVTMGASDWSEFH